MSKINETSKKFGRIQHIIKDLETLIQWHPESPNLNRQLAYLYLLSQGSHKSIQGLFQQAATSSQDKSDWYNVATVALKHNSEEWACYGLEQYFLSTRVTDNLDAWHVYIRLICKFDNYVSLNKCLQVSGRLFSPSEERTLLETGIFLLKVLGQELIATDLVQRWLSGKSLKNLVRETFTRFPDQPGERYQQIISEMRLPQDTPTEAQPQTEEPRSDVAGHNSTLVLSSEDIPQSQPLTVPPQSEGYIFHYRPDRGFGFIRGQDGTQYFFHQNAVVDDELKDKIVDQHLGRQTPVVFETTQGKKGPIAVGVSLYRTTGEMFDLALKYASDGEFSKAISQIRKVLATDPEYPQAQANHEKWREYARVTGVPRGKNPFAQAKRAQLLEKDLERAIPLFQKAITQGDNVESAIKDLAALLQQLGRTQEAINFLQANRNRIGNQQSVDNILIGFYQKAGKYDHALNLLDSRLKQETKGVKKVPILTQIAYCYLRKESFVQAESVYRSVLELQPENTTVRRNIAVCLFRQEKLDEAVAALNSVLDEFPDVKSVELLDIIKQAKLTGQTDQRQTGLILEISLPRFSTDITDFAQFFLQHCEFRGVPSDRVQNQQFDRSDIQNLENLASQLGTRRPRERSGYYLSAARLVIDLEEEDLNPFYRYLSRSLASMGDAAVVENQPLDTAQELYAEALAVYDGDRNRSSDPKHAVNALVRFLYATMGHSNIPIGQDIPTIAKSVKEVILQHPQRNKVFEAISYLISRSKYAAQRIVDCLYSEKTLQAVSLEFLKGKDVSIQRPIQKLDDFVALWNEIRRKNFDTFRTISEEFRLLRRFDFTTSTLEESIQRVNSQQHHLLYDLDQRRIRLLQNILDMALDQCKQVTFEERERLCIQIDGRCDDLLKDIKDNPTRLTVEEIYPIIEKIKEKVDERLEDLYRDSVPQVRLRLAIESYTSEGNRPLDIQIVIANEEGRSPAEALKLIFPEEDRFTLITPENKLDSSLLGGDQQILRVRVLPSEQAIQSQAFSLPVFAQYRTRSGDTSQTPVQNFSIRLNSDNDFQLIDNPYATYAEGGIVDIPEMFYGRQELIEKISSVFQESHVRSKSVVIFGQKRSGKSSTLHHLKQKLEDCKELLVVDLGNIGSILDDHSSVPLIHQIFWSILNKLEYVIEDKEVEEGFPLLNQRFPCTSDFYEHPTPIVYFKELFNRYKRHAARSDEWRNVRIVLLIDEFSYIHEQIVHERIPRTFMKNWKALLQEDYFNVVLVGQDDMPKFKSKFPNEFGTTQDERVTYLRKEDAKNLIDEPIRIGGRQGESRYLEQAIERILDLTAGSPFYIQIICNRLVDYMNRKRVPRVTSSDVEQVKDELIRDVNALGPDKFDNLISSGDTSLDAICDEDTLQVLKAIAVNSQTGPCNSQILDCDTKSSIETILEDLVHREVIECEREHYYQIRVGLFKEWLIAHP